MPTPKGQTREVEPLKPCPFCGGVAFLFVDGSTFIGCTNVDCPVLPRSRDAETTQKAAKDWNTRAPSPAIRELVEAAREVVELADRAAHPFPVAVWPITNRLRDALAHFPEAP